MPIARRGQPGHHDLISRRALGPEHADGRHRPRVRFQRPLITQPFDGSRIQPTAACRAIRGRGRQDLCCEGVRKLCNDGGL